MVINEKKVINETAPANLPLVRGRYSFDTLLSNLTWFQVGGPAEVLYKPFDTNDLQHFLKNISRQIPYLVIGAGSNILVRDGGYEGAIIKLGKEFAKMTIANNELIAGAAALDRTVAMFAVQHKIAGLEFLVTIPGSIGGAIAMNAGCYGFEVKDLLSWVEIIDSSGSLHRLSPDDLKMTYRKSILPEGCIIVRAAFKVKPGNSIEIQQRIQQYMHLREESQPIKGRTGGSTFKNPGPAKAWELIDQAGCRGIELGGAKISDKHCNFLLNTGSASADELEGLGELVRQRVKDISGETLEWEIIRIGTQKTFAQKAA